MATPPFVLDTLPLSAEIQKIAEEELRETAENVIQGLKELKKMLASDSSMVWNTDDEFLKIFLRPTKYYAQSAYELMKRISDFKTKNDDLFGNIFPAGEKDSFFNSDVVNFLTNRDHLGRRILILKLGETWTPSKISSDKILRMLYIIHLVAMIEPKTQVHGVAVIMDYKGLGMKQVAAMSPGFTMKLMTFIQDAMPFRLKEVHYVHNPMIFNLVWKLIKPLAKEKLSKRMHFHGSKMESLHKFIPPSHLPADYGGELPKIDYGCKDWYPGLEEYVDHFNKWNRCGKK